MCEYSKVMLDSAGWMISVIAQVCGGNIGVLRRPPFSELGPLAPLRCAAVAS